MTYQIKYNSYFNQLMCDIILQIIQKIYLENYLLTNYQMFHLFKYLLNQYHILIIIYLFSFNEYFLIYLHL